MTKQEFQILHSQIIEHFQLIEFNLKRICAQIQSHTFQDFLNNFSEYETDSMGQALNELKKLEKETGKTGITEADFKDLDEARKLRNYWCHQCFEDIVFSAGKNPCVRNTYKAKKTMEDCQFAEQLDYRVQEIYRGLIRPIQ